MKFCKLSVEEPSLTHTHTVMQTLSHMALADFCSMCATAICQQKEGKCLQQQAVCAAMHHAAPPSTTARTPFRGINVHVHGLSKTLMWDTGGICDQLSVLACFTWKHTRSCTCIWTGRGHRASEKRPTFLLSSNRGRPYGPEEMPYRLMEGGLFLCESRVPQHRSFIRWTELVLSLN